jgi:superfamily I DNA/RNA helicase
VRFIAVERTAAEEVISDRTLQSIEYETGRTLGNVLLAKLPGALLNPKIQVVSHSEGLFFLSAIDRSPDFVVFDLEASGLFGNNTSLADAILYFQKVLRFAVKWWSNLRLSITEHTLTNSKVAIFPYPLSQARQFRITVDLAPDLTRQSRRPTEGRSILVYRSGMDEGRGPNEEVGVTNFRRFLEGRPEVRRTGQSKPGVSGSPVISSLQVTSLGSHPDHHTDVYQGYERWMTLLTDAQKSFVRSPLQGAHRIEGPAGTGKTISLILKAIAGLHGAEEQGKPFKALFVTHSEATRRTVQQVIEANDPWGYLQRDPRIKLQTLRLTTLQQLCAELLNREISESEFLDRDAMESKQLQTLYISEALSAALKDDYPTHRKFLSPGFGQLLEASDLWVLAEMFQHEISVVIKGRADEQLDNYRKLPRLKYGLPVETSSDRGFVWTVFQHYQRQLQTTAQFDTDDIILTTIGQLDTPLWRRRREKEGYDGIYVDETHLFNINELSLFHFLTRSTNQNPIAYSVDRSQAVGDHGWTDELFDKTLAASPDSRERSERTEVHSIFRCSPEIVDLAFSVTSSGATLFTNFDDPLKLASSMLTGEEERKCSPPQLLMYATDELMVEDAFRRADQLANDMETGRSGVALVAFTDELFRSAQAYSELHNKPVELLKRRGDIDVIHRAEKSGRFLLSTPEYIGGLEFDGIVLLGVDEGRVPPTKTLQSADSANFLAYSSHNRLYVAITRARYRVEILASKQRGPSPLLKTALHAGILIEAVDEGRRSRQSTI